MSSSDSHNDGVCVVVAITKVHLSSSSLLGGSGVPTGSQSVKSTMSGVKEPAQSYTTATRLFAGNRREHTPIVGCRTLTVRNSVLGSGKTLAARAS